MVVVVDNLWFSVLIFFILKMTSFSSNSSSRGWKVLNLIELHILRKVSRDAEYDAEGDAKDLLKL